MPWGNFVRTSREEQAYFVASLLCKHCPSPTACDGCGHIEPPSEREVAFSQENDGRSERVQTNLLFVWVCDAIVARAPSAVTRSVLLPSLPEEGFRAQYVPFVQTHKFDTFCLQSAKRP